MTGLKYKESSKSLASQEKLEIKSLIDKIKKVIETKDGQKKAAHIITSMIGKDEKKPK